MQSKINAALTTVSPSLEPANDAFWIVVEGTERVERQLGSGWDPYEVWRTRIRALRNHPDRDSHGV